MAAFQRPFDPAMVVAGAASVSLPDSRQSSGGLTHFARYPMRELRFLTARPVGTDFAFRWPASSAVRRVDLLAAEAAALGVTQLVQLSPFPFAIAGVLRALGAGLPTFYIGFNGPALPDHDSAVRTSEAPFTVTRAVIACMLQDRMTLEPWAWIELIGNVLDAADAAQWRTLSSLFPSRSLQVRNPAGEPAANETFVLQFRDGGGNVVRQITATSDAAGNLGAAALPQAGETATLQWQPAALAGDEALPVVALYERALAEPANDAMRTYPGEPALVLPAQFNGGHLQVLDLARWFAPALQSPGKPWPSRFHGGTRVEPLVDGLITYTKLVADIRRASGIHIAGWSFEDFPLRPYDPSSSLGELLESIGRDKFRILVVKSFNPKTGVLDNLATEGLAAAMILMAAAEPLIVKDKMDVYNNVGILLWHAAAIAALATIIIDVNEPLKEKLREMAEFTKKPARELLYDVSNGKPNCAFPAPHPVAIADNPVGHEFSVPGFGTLSAIQELWGVYHQKFQVVAVPEGSGTNFVGYLGGLDIRANRVDTPGHHAAQIRSKDSLSAPAPSPYHDVHARVTGPASFDLVGLFHERYLHARDHSPVGIEPEPLFHPPAVPLEPAFQPPPAPPARAGQHLARIAQTSSKPAPGREGLPWAPNGDAPIRETFERAIRSAREYIYIEEQYFTLDDGLIQILRDAADHCRRLAIVVASSTPDQFLGDQRRLATFDRLAGATGGPGGWGDRMIAGAPYRRPVLPPADFTASLGRASLLEPVATATESKIYVGPVPRVPTSTPYFFFVAGELMYATKARPLTSPSGKPSVELDVLRGSLHGTGPKWCPNPRAHKAGAPVTFSSPRSIFVHAKLLMVDDIFCAIGSANWNRRGFYHDGEVDVFAIPDRLKGSRDNPAFQLRTQLWAEQLGLIPLMGSSLLADPVEAFDLFHRTRYQGNRFSEHREFLAPRGDLTALNDLKLFQIIPDSVKVTLIATANAFLATQTRNIFNTVSDPTTGIDPNPREGPELP